MSAATVKSFFLTIRASGVSAGDQEARRHDRFSDAPIVQAMRNDFQPDPFTNFPDLPQFPFANKKDIEHMTEVCFPSEEYSIAMDRNRRELTELFKRHDVGTSEAGLTFFLYKVLGDVR